MFCGKTLWLVASRTAKKKRVKIGFLVKFLVCFNTDPLRYCQLVLGKLTRSAYFDNKFIRTINLLEWSNRWSTYRFYHRDFDSNKKILVSKRCPSEVQIHTNWYRLVRKENQLEDLSEMGLVLLDLFLEFGFFGLEGQCSSS